EGVERLELLIEDDRVVPDELVPESSEVDEEGHDGHHSEQQRNQGGWGIAPTRRLLGRLGSLRVHGGPPSVARIGIEAIRIRFSPQARGRIGRAASTCAAAGAEKIAY